MVLQIKAQRSALFGAIKEPVEEMYWLSINNIGTANDGSNAAISKSDLVQCAI